MCVRVVLAHVACWCNQVEALPVRCFARRAKWLPINHSPSARGSMAAAEASPGSDAINSETPLLAQTLRLRAAGGTELRCNQCQPVLRRLRP